MIIMETNKFGRFFYSPSYIKMKNMLFNYRFRKESIKRSIDKYLSTLKDKSNIKILDIGSGISPVSPFPSKTIFVDLEKEAIDLLKKKGVNAQVGDITKLKFKKGEFDIVLCSEVLEHVPDYNLGLKEMARVLKKNGIVIITVPIHQYYWKDDDEFVGHFRRFNPKALQKDIESAGLRVITRKPIGSWLERNLTWLVVKIARRNTSGKMEAGKLKLFAFNLINSILFQAIKIANYFTSEENSSIIMFVAKKD